MWVILSALIVIVCKEEALEGWRVIIVIRLLGGDLHLIIFKDLKAFYADKLILILDVQSIDCMIVVAH